MFIVYLSRLTNRKCSSDSVSDIVVGDKEPDLSLEAHLVLKKVVMMMLMVIIGEKGVVGILLEAMLLLRTKTVDVLR